MTAKLLLEIYNGEVREYGEGRTYVRPVDRFMPARMVETVPG